MTATELELLACFGVEPQLLDAGVPWYCNDAVYAIEADEYSVSFAIAPAYPDVRIVVSQDVRRVFEFNSRGILDVRIIDEPGVDAIELIVDEGSWLRLQLRPAFQITQEFVAEGRTLRS